MLTHPPEVEVVHVGRHANSPQMTKKDLLRRPLVAERAGLSHQAFEKFEILRPPPIDKTTESLCCSRHFLNALIVFVQQDGPAGECAGFRQAYQNGFRWKAQLVRV